MATVSKDTLKSYFKKTGKPIPEEAFGNMIESLAHIDDIPVQDHIIVSNQLEQTNIQVYADRDVQLLDLNKEDLLTNHNLNINLLIGKGIENTISLKLTVKLLQNKE